MSAVTVEFRAQFEACISRVESRGLIRRLSFGDLILLQPELLDAYASALVNAAKDEPEGLGCIAEEDARIGRFRMPADERIQDKKQESLLLIATIEEMLRHEIALREQADDGPYLVFPSQFTREWSEAPDPEGKSVIFEFEGPVLNIYATLAVRLSRSGFFARKAMWKNAAEYSARAGGGCGILLREVKEGSGELALFYDQAASEETRLQFEEYVRIHLQRRALSASLHQRRILVCSLCGFIVTAQLRRLLIDQDRHQLDCPVCQTLIGLSISEVRPTIGREARVQQMDAAADIRREHDTAISILQGKTATNDFDIFLCHNSTDKRSVKTIGEKLKEHGILPWLDEWELRPGFSWQKALEEQIKKGKSVAVFVGKQGIAPWQDKEIETFLRQGAKRECPIIPVVLRNCRELPELPLFLENFQWVDFRKKQPNPLQQLVWGITGERVRL